jgi:nucleotide-binding universal stress UspA family protein
MYKSILVPLDGSSLAESALPAAIRLARRHAAQLELISFEITLPTTVISVGLSTREVAPPPTEDPTLAYLESVSRRIAEVYPVPVKQTIRTGYARGAPALLRYVRESGTDLVVMATHGYGPVRRFWLGSFADAVARESHLPTLLVRPPTDGAVDLHAEPRFQRILCALDGSPASAKILEHARAAADENAEFILLRIIQPPVPVGLDVSYLGVSDYPLGALPVDEQTMLERRAAAQRELEQAADSFRERKLRVSTEVIEHPFIAGAILEYAEHGQVDLIALTTHGRGGAVRLVLGSVADKVVRGAQLPVLLFRAPD